MIPTKCIECGKGIEFKATQIESNTIYEGYCGECDYHTNVGISNK